MELNLKKETFSYYEAVTETPFSFETTQETIVPDYCQDVARVVDTTGVVLVHNKEMTPDGRVEVGGAIKATVLFIPEGGTDLCALHLSIPFHSYCEGRNLASCARYTVSARLRGIDSRLLNPRKLLTRAEITLEPVGYCQKEASLCTAVEADESCGLQFLEECADTTVITDVLEREFPYTEELGLSAGRSGIQEILDTATHIYPADSKIVGNKLVLKGIIRSDVLYKDQEGALATLTQEFLFSQIVETSASEESGMAKATFDLTGYEYLIGTESEPEDTHSITMSLHIRSNVEVLETKRLRFLSDLYSIAKNVVMATQPLPLVEDVRSFTKKQNMRETLETAVAVRQVCHAAVSCGTCTCQVGEGMATAQIPVTIKALYLDENDAVLLAEKNILVKGEMEAEEGSIPHIALHCPGEITGTPTPEGMEIRFTLEFWMDTGKQVQKLCIADASLEELEPSAQRQPSVILRKFDQSTRLWDIAKQYRTTCADILAANQVESEQAIPTDKLLLIPRRKI